MTKERSIILNNEEVRAILEGRKTQTRRIIKPQPFDGVRDSPFVKSGIEDLHGYEVKEKYAIGDRLWVRETWRWFDAMKESDQDGVYSGYQYRADIQEIHNEGLKWKPSIHMPRAASRILLEITDVRVERLLDISEADAINEGISGNFGFWKDYINNNDTACNLPQESYKSLMQKKYGADFVEKNPWMRAITFKKI